MSRPVWIRWLILFGAIWLILAVLYAFMAAQSRRSLGLLIDSGVSLAASTADQAGMPLLDQDINSLHRMLKAIGERPDVLRASVIDHKNKIIAYTDAGRLLTHRGEKIEQIGGVDTWRDHEAMVFATPISFADTPIGEIRLALSLNPVVQPKHRFAMIAAVVLALAVMLPVWVYGRQWLQRFKETLQGRQSGATIRLLLCPLCGQTAERGARFCHASNMDNSPLIRILGNGANDPRGTALRLSDIGTDPALAPVRDQMIRQCADIIKRLAVEEPPALRQARENQR